MSRSKMYGIRSDYTGTVLFEYPNSWLFSPNIWEMLPNKYIPDYIETPYGYKLMIIEPHYGPKVWSKTNEKVNNCDNTPDRVCWELSNQNIFSTNDKDLIADSIIKFTEQNIQYLEASKPENIIKRFSEIASNIRSIDEKEYPYFVFKNTTCDDGVENWFEKYDEETGEYIECSMIQNSDHFLTEFVLFKDGKIDKFVSSEDYFKEKTMAEV